MNKGYTNTEASFMVFCVVEACQNWLDLNGSDLSGWFGELHAEAWARMQATTSPATRRQENDHGDRNTSPGRSSAGQGEQSP